MAEYPLQRRFLAWGLWAGCFTNILLMDLLTGFSVLVLFWCVGFLWRSGEPPILALAVAVQWLGVVIGYFFKLLVGFYPAGLIPGDVEGAIVLSLLGMLFMTGGLRAAFFFLRRRLQAAENRLQTTVLNYNVARLFRYVVIIYGINWFFDILPKAIFFNAAEFIQNGLEFRGVILCLLFVAIIRQRQRYVYGALALLFTGIPRLGAKHVEVFEAFVYLLPILLAEWRPKSRSMADRRRNLRVLLACAVIVMSLGYMSLIWQESIKSGWRAKLAAGEVASTPVERAREFISMAEEASSQYGSGGDSGLLPGEDLVERLWEGLIFTYVLERVPQVLPHEGGNLTLRALQHAIVPRFLFPDKPVLGSNSWLVVKYAGIEAAGEEEATSIGFGHMAELYVDFGSVGMLIALFMWGFIIGLTRGALLLVSPSRYFFMAALSPMFLQTFVSQAEVAYMLGGLMNRLVVYALSLYFICPWLHRKLLMKTSTSEVRFQRMMPFRIP